MNICVLLKVSDAAMLLGDSLNNLKIMFDYMIQRKMLFFNHCIKRSRQFERESITNYCKLYTNEEELAEADKFGIWAKWMDKFEYMKLLVGR